MNYGKKSYIDNGSNNYGNDLLVSKHPIKVNVNVLINFLLTKNLT